MSRSKTNSRKGAAAKSSSGNTLYPAEVLNRFYRAILLPRLIEERMLLLLRQGRLKKWFSGIGQEAISVGATLAMRDDEYVVPMHRNLGVFTTRGVPLPRLFQQWQGKPGGFTNGRDRSYYFGSQEHRIIGTISHLGQQLCVAAGIGLGEKLECTERATVVFTGEGGTSEGDFHEALNVAAVWDLPVIFLIENNGWGISTPVSEQYRCRNLSDRAVGYGIEGVTIDGNDLLEVYETIQSYAAQIRKQPRPVLIECLTYRMRGHEEASGVKYVPKEMLEAWGKKDPVQRFEERLCAWQVLKPEESESIKSELRTQIEAWVEEAFAAPGVVVDAAREVRDLFAPPAEMPKRTRSAPSREMRYVDAIQDGLRVAMRRHSGLVLMGQDIAEYGGVFKITEGFLEEFGRDRVRNTPLCESAILGAAMGLSIKGIKSMVELQFSDFVSCGFNQIVNNIAKLHWRWGQRADIVMRMPTGAGTAAGPYHSQSTEAWFAHVPGLKLVYPAFPADAKGLLLAAFDDPNPVMYFEHKLLYRSIKEQVPEGEFFTEIGKANVLREGDQVTIITYGAGAHWALEVLGRYPEISAMLVDLRTLAPLDWECIDAAVKHTGRVIVLHEDTLTGGIGAEIAALIAERCFEHLDAPVIRSASMDTPVPYAEALENQFLPRERFEHQLLDLVKY
ncbi:MAG: dehydrogenase E1 component subunit alpha/beta [Oligoflexia bacterium]|nr:dehydrogenase E1 component subunit alpha/beta [Oligoflexia bacterium]